MGGALLMMLVLVTRGRAATTTGPSETTLTTEPEPTGSLKFGDKCTTTQECGFRGSICDNQKCQCKPEFPVTNHIDMCGVQVDINGTCFFNEQCETRVLQTECKDGKCACRFEKVPILNKNHQLECITAPQGAAIPEDPVDPAMIGVLVGMALMFIIICVVLRLFSKARWRENRTIFNTPNPRLMNVSLLRDTKPPERRGSKGSNTRVPSRQPSIASLRPTSPSHSQGSRRGSGASGGSVRSPTHPPHSDGQPPLEMQPK